MNKILLKNLIIAAFLFVMGILSKFSNAYTSVTVMFFLCGVGSIIIGIHDSRK